MLHLLQLVSITTFKVRLFEVDSKTPSLHLHLKLALKKLKMWFSIGLVINEELTVGLNGIKSVCYNSTFEAKRKKYLSNYCCYFCFSIKTFLPKKSLINQLSAFSRLGM